MFIQASFLVYAACFLIIESEILSKPREWLFQKSSFAERLLTCYFCTGFWVALLLMGPLLLEINNSWAIMLDFAHIVLYFFCCLGAAATAYFSSLFAGVMITYIGKNHVDSE